MIVIYNKDLCKIIVWTYVLGCKKKWITNNKDDLLNRFLQLYASKDASVIPSENHPSFNYGQTLTMGSKHIIGNHIVE